MDQQFKGEFFEMESPLMNGGGLVKTVEDVRQMASTGVGAVLAGSFTLEARAGNSPNGEVVYFHDEQTRVTYNSLGMPNQGLEALAADLPQMQAIAHDHGKPLMINLAPVSDDPVSEVVKMGEVLARAGVEQIDGIEINASCPNVVLDDGGRHELLSHHPEQLGEAILAFNSFLVDEVDVGLLAVRISPFRSQDDVVPLVGALKSAEVGAASAFNTFPGGRPVTETGDNILAVPNGIGGRSGLGMAKVAEEQTRWLVGAADLMQAQFDIIGSNGVGDVFTLDTRLKLGVDAVSATTLFTETVSWKTAVNTLLSNYTELQEM